VNKRSFGGRFRSVGPALLFVLSALALTIPTSAHAQERPGALQLPNAQEVLGALDLPSAQELLSAQELPGAWELPGGQEMPSAQEPPGAQELPSEHETQSSLFTSDEVIEFSLETNFVKLKADRGLDPEYRPAILTLTSDDGTPRAIDIKVKTRGHFRLENCRFPPLKVNLPKKSLGGTVFDGEDKLKLVAHCRNRDSAEQNVLEEYLAYRTYNVLTDNSFRVRLARITYIDSRGKDDPITRYAFFIEEKEAVAERVGGIMLDVPQVHPTNLSDDASARMALFQYMVGNTDWDMVYFHNVKLLRTDDGIYIPVPYDFDFAGLVAASYATPDERLGLRTIKDRMYRGFCRPQVDFASMYSDFTELRPEIEEIYMGVEGLEDGKKKNALKYVDGFYDIISSERRSRVRIEQACRRV